MTGPRGRRSPVPPPRPPRAPSRSSSRPGSSRSSPAGCRSRRRPRRTSTSPPRSTCRPPSPLAPGSRRSPGKGRYVPSFNDMVVKACAIALRKFPRANGSYRDGRLELHSRVNVGIAVAADDALLVPTILDADRKGLREIAAEARSLAAKVREGRVTPPELSGATFSVSNLGMYGISSFQAIVDPPQAAHPRRRGDRRAAGGPRRRGRPRQDHGDDPLLRPPDPLRRRGRGIPRRGQRHVAGAARAGVVIRDQTRSVASIIFHRSPGP